MKSNHFTFSFLRFPAIYTLLVLFAVAGCQKKVPEGVLDFSLKNLEGKTVSLSEYKGQLVLVVFWASWCHPCLQEIPDLIELQERYKNKNFTVLSINMDEPAAREIQVPKLKKQYENWNYEILIASESVIRKFGGIQGIPTSFFIDKEGKVLDKLEGAVPRFLLESAIQNFLASS